MKQFLSVSAACLMLLACEQQSTGTVEGYELPEAGVATAATAESNAAVAAALPLEDQDDFDRAKRGLLAQIDGPITADDGRVVWDQGAYEFLAGPAPESVNPSLWRQAQLNHIHGLFEVADGLYQLRGYDLSVMTVIRGQTGWVIIDPLLSKETAAASLKLLNDTLGERPVTAVLFTHSHVDHFGGVRGVLSEEEIAAGEIPIVAPVGFGEHAIAENLLAGIAMSRRSNFQFARALGAGPTARVDSGIGIATSLGTIGYVDPNFIVEETGEQHTFDGVEFHFINASHTEAPAEFMFYFPQFKAMHTAELATGTLHNVLTLRGAQIRDALAWAKGIDEALQMFPEAEIQLASHNWPTWGQAEVRQYLQNQRDTYRFIHDQTLRLANQGYTPHEIAAAIGEPGFMSEDFNTRGYYGTVNHNSKAVYQFYFGWWDGVPATLNPLPPEEEAARWVNLAGAEAMLNEAARAFGEGDYRWVASLMNALVFAEPKNSDAKVWLAAAYEQLGFQSESSNWRNYYLAAAHELREGKPERESVNLANADFVKAVPTANYFEALAVRLNPAKAEDITLNLDFTDTGEKLTVMVRDGVTTHRVGSHNPEAKTVLLKRADLDEVTLGQAGFREKFFAGAFEGKDGAPRAFGKFLQMHDQFDPVFDVVEP